MSKDLITEIINGMSKIYGYGIIQIEDNYKLPSNWALVKDIGYNYKRVVIFIDDLFKSEDEKMIYRLKNDLNTENIQIIKILLGDISKLSREEGISSEINKANTILIDSLNNKVLASSNESEELAYELVNVLNYLKNQSAEKSDAKSKPWITYGIIAINVIMFIIEAVLSNDYLDINNYVLVFLGAKYNKFIDAGEYYRLITCMFLHGGLMHIALNMYSLYSIGPLVEKIYGKFKYIVIYLLSGIISSLFSYMFSEGISVGASGAIFGLLGTTLVFAIKMKESIGKDFLRSIASVIIINLFIGFTIPNIDNFAHLGGLIGGVITTLILDFAHKTKIKAK